MTPSPPRPAGSETRREFWCSVCPHLAHDGNCPACVAEGVVASLCVDLRRTPGDTPE